MARISTVRTPIGSVIIEGGGSGGAVALAVAVRVLMLDGAIYSVTAPEGAAAILFRDGERAPEISSTLKSTAHDLKCLNLVDEIVPELDDSPDANPDPASAPLSEASANALAKLQRKRIGRVVQERYDCYQRLGKRHTRRPMR